MRQRFTLNSYKSSVDLSEKIVKHASSHSFGDLSASNRDLTTYSSTRQAVKIEDIGFNQLKETTDHELTTSVGKLVSTSAIGQDRSELSATEIDPQCNQLDLESLKIDLYSLTKKASEKTSQLSFYDFLLSHCFKLKRFLVSESAAIGDVQTELQTLAFLSADKPQIFEVFTVWGKLQVALLDHFSRIEENHKQKTASFEAMEKKVLKLEKTVQERFENNTQETAKDSQTLFKTKPEVANTPVATSVFASLPPATSTPTKKDIKPSANSGTVPNSPKAESSARQLRHPVSRASRSMQTDAKILIDATTGPNDTIPTYRTKECQADLRHPIQDIHDQLIIDYHTLKELHELTKKEASEKIATLTASFEKEISEAHQNLKVEKELRLKFMTSSRQENNKLLSELERKSESNNVLTANLEVVSKAVVELEANVEKLTVENNTVIEERHKLLEKSNDLQKELAIVNETLQKLDNEILNLKTENQIFKTENCELKTAVEGFTERTASLSKDLIEAKEQTKEATLAKKNILEQYYEELEFRKDLEIKNSQLKKNEVESNKVQESMTGLVEELQEIVAKLMQFPDLSVQDEFDISAEPIQSAVWVDRVHHMVEHNNLRISLLEQRNNRYRELLLDQASTQGYDAYTKYHPISAITPLFNIKAIEGYEKSMNEKEVRPDTGATTVNYVIGGVNNEIKRVSRPVTVKGKPVLSKVNGEIEFDFIDDAVDTSYPPKFPLVTPNGSRKIKSSRSTPKKPLTAKARPNTAKSFKWDHETIDYV